jgi:hypothetical protein
LVDSHPFLRTGWDLMPLLAGNSTGVTTDASTLIEIEPILTHFLSLHSLNLHQTSYLWRRSTTLGIPAQERGR